MTELLATRAKTHLYLIINKEFILSDYDTYSEYKLYTAKLISFGSLNIYYENDRVAKYPFSAADIQRGYTIFETFLGHVKVNFEE